MAAAPPVVSGEISAPQPDISGLSNDALNTLDEPVLTTILRDLRRIKDKLRAVLWKPSDADAEELAEADLWGPLLLTLSLSVVLSLTAPDGQGADVFASVFALIAMGSAVITVNSQLLGASLSFLNTACLLCYAVFPLLLAAVLCLLSSAAVWRTPLIVGAAVWSTRACLVLMRPVTPLDRLALAAYPVALFFGLLAWLVSMMN